MWTISHLNGIKKLSIKSIKFYQFLYISKTINQKIKNAWSSIFLHRNSLFVNENATKFSNVLRPLASLHGYNILRPRGARGEARQHGIGEWSKIGKGLRAYPKTSSFGPMRRSRSFSILEIVTLFPRLKKSRSLAWNQNPRFSDRL